MIIAAAAAVAADAVATILLMLTACHMLLLLLMLLVFIRFVLAKHASVPVPSDPPLLTRWDVMARWAVRRRLSTSARRRKRRLSKRARCTPNELEKY